jgi:hypothetical protein
MDHGLACSPPREENGCSPEKLLDIEPEAEDPLDDGLDSLTIQDEPTEDAVGFGSSLNQAILGASAERVYARRRV